MIPFQINFALISSVTFRFLVFEFYFVLIFCICTPANCLTVSTVLPTDPAQICGQVKYKPHSSPQDPYCIMTTEPPTRDFGRLTPQKVCSVPTQQQVECTPASVQILRRRRKFLAFAGNRIMTKFDVSLIVHLSITLANVQLDAQIFNTFITILYMYMFRAISCSSSGGQIVLIQYLVSSLSVSDRPVHRLRENYDKLA